MEKGGTGDSQPGRRTELRDMGVVRQSAASHDGQGVEESHLLKIRSEDFYDLLRITTRSRRSYSEALSNV